MNKVFREVTIIRTGGAATGSSSNKQKNNRRISVANRRKSIAKLQFMPRPSALEIEKRQSKVEMIVEDSHSQSSSNSQLSGKSAVDRTNNYSDVLLSPGKLGTPELPSNEEEMDKISREGKTVDIDELLKGPQLSATMSESSLTKRQSAMMSVEQVSKIYNSIATLKSDVDKHIKGFDLFRNHAGNELS